MDAALVRELLWEQHPDLAEGELRFAAQGWDNELWRLGDGLAVRLPYATERASELLRREFRWVPGLAAGLPLPVPTPVRLGVPSERFPGNWTIVRWIAGNPVDRVPISRGRAAAEALAGFLRALHQPAPAAAPVTDRGDTVIRELRPEMPGDSPRLRAIWADAVAAPLWPGPRLWLHGDLHPANVLTSNGTLSGVIDFGDLCTGDPALDLAAAWLLLPADAIEYFFDRYARADEATVRRARGWVILRANGLIEVGRAGEQGRPGGKKTWGVAGRLAVDRLLATS